MSYNTCKAIAYSLFLTAFLLGASSTLVFDVWINQGAAMRVVERDADAEAYSDTKALYARNLPQPMSNLAGDDKKQVASASCCR